MSRTKHKEYTEEMYYSSQFLMACPLPLFPENKNGTIRLKVHTEHGETNWLNITPAQFKQIEEILVTANDQHR